MAIPKVTEEQFKKIIADNLTPSEEIRTPERLFGREKNLRSIERALNSPGRQIFVCGERGVGKTSLAVTAAYMHSASKHKPIYIPCGRTTTFAAAIQAIGNHTISIKDRMEKPGSGRTVSLSMAGFGGSYHGGTQGSNVIPQPSTIDEALNIIRYVAEKYDGRIIIVLDEMERVQSKSERDMFAEFIKNIPTLSVDVRFIFCGIASEVDELINSHPSAGRILETVPLERLHHSYLWQIITTVSDKLGIEIDREMLVRISQISDGFPHFVHLIGDTLFWNIYDDPEVSGKASIEQFKASIKGALQRSDAVLRAQYQKATQKTKNTSDYEEALWALADTNSDKRQIQEIYDSSYIVIMNKRTGRVPLPRDIFNQRLHALRKESHGEIIIGHGSGWFNFRDNIMRGYVRLRAEDNGLQIGRGPI
jgi:hypothetical protein